MLDALQLSDYKSDVIMHKWRASDSTYKEGGHRFDGSKKRLQLRHHLYSVRGPSEYESGHSLFAHLATSHTHTHSRRWTTPWPKILGAHVSRKLCNARDGAIFREFAVAYSVHRTCSKHRAEFNLVAPRRRCPQFAEQKLATRRIKRPLIRRLQRERSEYRDNNP